MARASSASRELKDHSRSPLRDGTCQANILPANLAQHPKKHNRPTPSASYLPVELVHHDSLLPNDPLVVKNGLDKVGRVEEQPASKRDSQVSNASTTASTKARRIKTHIGPWQLGSDIGMGGCGMVRKVRHRVTGQIAAVKVISKKIARKMGSESLANLEKSSKEEGDAFASFTNMMPFGIEREVVIMKVLDSPFIVKLYDAWENRSELYLIMEYCDGGELFDYISARGQLAEDESVYFFRQMVAALLHCSRIGIHHRDLKPENILCNEQGFVKLADFGMAALQPKGGRLTTPCGSLLYAAPEVWDQHYDGSKIDVWSLGIILYVMLTGSTPFNMPVTCEQDVGKVDRTLWLEILKAGDFEMPQSLSDEAKHCLSRMLDPEPQTRISLEGLWTHPFLRQFCQAWGEPSDHMDLARWIGGSLLIEHWEVAEKEDIDREILRNLRTLWHSVKEDKLVQKILSPEPNQEKFFYYALQKHREEQLENYAPDALDQSTSDYHHVKPSPKAAQMSPQDNALRTRSQFSILNDEHIQSRNSFLEPPPTERSYDPYRASRVQMSVSRKDSNMHVTVHRAGLDNGNNSGKHSFGARSLRQPGSLRITALKQEQRRSSMPSRASSMASVKTTSSARPASANRRSMSRASLASSTLSNSPIIHRTKPSIKHKRAVNFSHVRKTSNPIVSATHASKQITTSANLRLDGHHSSPDMRKSTASHMDQGDPVVRVVMSRKENRRNSSARPTDRGGMDSTNTIIDSEARKVSSELSQFCEDAFQMHRSSGMSSDVTSSATYQDSYETPSSSIGNLASTKSMPSLAPMIATPNRPLPEVPPATPRTVVARELADTRKRLLAYAAEEQDANNKPYTDVIARIDTLLKPRLSTSESRRTMSLPEKRHSEVLSFLPSISEEGRIHDVEHLDSSDRPSVAYRPLVQATRTMQQSKKEAPPSIRIIDPLSPHAPPAPLNIRKISHGSSTMFEPGNGNLSRSVSNDEPSSGLASHFRRITTPTSPGRLSFFLAQASEGSSTSGGSDPKRKAWWRRDKTLASTADRTGAGSPTFLTTTTPGFWKRTVEPQNQEFSNTLSQGGGIAGKRPGFLGFLRRTHRSAQDQMFLRTDESSTSPAVPSPSMLSDSVDIKSEERPGHSLGPTEQVNVRALGVQQSWFARFLHLKPATKVLCCHTTRGRVRSEIMRLLKAWGVHGIRDVVLDQTRKFVFARLDAVNVLGLKEVEFVVELFVVLHSGARKGLSIARFTQRKGAASSMRRIASEIESRLGALKYLVEDKTIRKEMEAVLAEGQLGR